ncbi:MAG: GNAT family N-acetyltransferase [Polyangiaceae bacterium]
MGNAQLEVRTALPSDVSAIAQLHVRAWQIAYRGHMSDEFLSRLDPVRRAPMWERSVADPKVLVLVALQREKLLGFCSVVPTRDADAAPETAELTTIYVEPERCRAGVGSALLEAAIEQASHRTFRQISLWVLDGNLGAQAFYRAHGFEPDGAAKTEQLPGFSIRELRFLRGIGSR